ncbi:hypothetical protein [Leptolyngbya sp. O-77]|uniref:hypothetical protein n=1 Tax=Leptolyngbya sp. O-77 TaxID=1080068 RepID=UPI00074D2934|nr:hypothetical protein [Leptolyngbya sp. O-77]BAU42840.1 hypothetical protein O77CONTIG1_02662 [Leptolyngbya sp. O-77]
MSAAAAIPKCWRRCTATRPIGERPFCITCGTSDAITALHCHKADWWKTCHITQEGTLASSDAIVNMLLSPMAVLHADSQPSRTLQLAA